VIGQRILLNGYDADGRAELEFRDNQGVIHFIYVDPKFLNNPDQCIMKERPALEDRSWMWRRLRSASLCRGFATLRRRWGGSRSGMSGERTAGGYTEKGFALRTQNG
jgi:hypothetical protein